MYLFMRGSCIVVTTKAMSHWQVNLHCLVCMAVIVNNNVDIFWTSDWPVLPPTDNHWLNNKTWLLITIPGHSRAFRNRKTPYSTNFFNCFLFHKKLHYSIIHLYMPRTSVIWNTHWVLSTLHPILGQMLAMGKLQQYVMVHLLWVNFTNAVMVHLLWVNYEWGCIVDWL